MENLEFFMPMKKPPTVTHQEKQVVVIEGKAHFYEPMTLKSARARLTAQLAQHRPDAPLTGPLRLVTRWLFPPGRHTPGTYRATRPDTDNLQKLLKDCMTATGFWHDDAQVASELCEKFWAEDDRHTGIYICITELEDMR